MSRIGKKPIPLPQGVKFEVKGNTVVVQGPKGQVQTHLPSGVELKQADGHIQVTR
jgi:large subunit ribosomal protein L6